MDKHKHDTVELPAIPPATLQIAEDLTNITHIMKWAQFPVKTESDTELAVGAMAEVKTRTTHLYDEMDRRWGNEKRALRKLLKMITDYEKGVEEAVVKPITIVSKTLKTRIEQFWVGRQAKLEAEAKAAHERAKTEEAEKLKRATELATTTGNTDAITEMMQRERNVEKMDKKEVKVSQTIRTGGATLAQTKVWKWRVIDPQAIPGSFMIIDEKQINGIARGYSKRPEKIPGIEFYQEVRSSLKV